MKHENNIDADLVARALDLYRSHCAPPPKPVVIIDAPHTAPAPPVIEAPRNLTLPPALDRFRRIYAVDTEALPRSLSFP
jgi:hypothetical protein